MENHDNSNDDYNSIITIGFILSLIIVRIFINSYSKQNIIIALINFFSMFYVLWRIYFRINAFLKNRCDKTILFKNQHKRFNRHFRFMIVLLLIFISIYITCLILVETFYPFGSCINDILSLLALLFSIEDEKIVNKAIEYYKYS